MSHPIIISSRTLREDDRPVRPIELHGAHGVAFDDAVGHGFISSGRDSTVVMFDLKTPHILARTTAAADDDAILYDPASKHIITFKGDAHSATVIDPVTGARIGTIDLGSAPEFGVADGAGKLYVNLTDAGEVAEIDAVAMRVTRRWSVAPCQHATGIAIDRVSRRIFSSNGEGTMTVVHDDGSDHYRVAATIPTMPGAHTMTIDPTRHVLYTVSAQLQQDTANGQRGRTVLPNTFTLLVLEPVLYP